MGVALSVTPPTATSTVDSACSTRNFSPSTSAERIVLKTSVAAPRGADLDWSRKGAEATTSSAETTMLTRPASHGALQYRGLRSAGACAAQATLPFF